MCKPYPGPRCSNHAAKALEKAKERLVEVTDDFDSKPDPVTSAAKQSAQKAVADAQEAYYATPEGIKQLNAAGKPKVADYYAKILDGQKKAYKKQEKIRKAKESIANLPDGGSEAYERKTPVTSAPTCKQETVTYWKQAGYKARKDNTDWQNPKAIDAIVRAELKTDNMSTTYQNVDLEAAGLETLELMREKSVFGDEPSDSWNQDLHAEIAKRHEDEPKKDPHYWVGSSTSEIYAAAENETNPAVLAAIAEYSDDDLYVHTRLANNHNTSRETIVKLHDYYEELSERKGGLEDMEAYAFELLDQSL